MARKTETITPKTALKGCISASDLCSLTGLTDRRHRQLASSGYFPAPDRGRYELNATLAGLFRHFREQLSKKNSELVQEQRRLAKAKRETVEEELAILREQYVKKAIIGPALRNISLHQRAKLQFKLESELGPTLVGMHTLEIRGKMAAAVDEICQLFRDGVKEWMSSPPAVS